LRSETFSLKTINQQLSQRKLDGEYL